MPTAIGQRVGLESGTGTFFTERKLEIRSDGLVPSLRAFRLNGH